MSSKYRISFQRRGVRYDYAYRNSLEGAVKVGSSKGFRQTDDNSYWGVPDSALIERRGEEWACGFKTYCEWLEIATINSKGITARPFEDRRDIIKIENKIVLLHDQVSCLRKEINQLGSPRFQKLVENRKVKA